jgi:HSP20 family protein
MRNKELMTLEPETWMRQIFRDFDRFFNERGLPFARPRWREHDELPWLPDMEVFERPDGLALRVDLPGLTKEDVTIEVVEGVLTIAGERKHETKEERAGWYTSERSYGKFYRAFPLPEGANATGITGRFANGVLEIAIPVAAKAIAPPVYKVPVEDATDKKVAKAAA